MQNVPYNAIDAATARPDPRIEAIQCHNCWHLVRFDTSGHAR